MSPDEAEHLDPSAPIEVAPRVWWVGSVLEGDRFQCHSYLVEAGERSVLIDPGSVLTIEETMRKVEQVVPLEWIKWVVCLHSDPDVAGAVGLLGERLMRADARIVSEWRAATMIKHYASALPIRLVEDLDWEIPLDDGRSLLLLLTPYLHYPGAMVAYETGSGVLFSSDLFGGFSDGTEILATDAEVAFEGMRLFHEHYMPSREILANGLGRIRRRFEPINLVAPQHGLMIPVDLVDDVFERMRRLDCGLFLMAHDNEDVAELLRYSAVLRSVEEMVATTHDVDSTMERLRHILSPLVGLRSVELAVEEADGSVLRFGSTRPQGPPGQTLQLPTAAEATGASFHVELDSLSDLDPDVIEVLERTGEILGRALDRYVRHHREKVEQDKLRERVTLDALTSLHNRYALDLVDDADPHGVLMIDLDDLKEVNDNFGHAVGDEVLRRIATVLAGTSRAGDLVVRYGGDELLVVLAGVDQVTAASVADRIRHRIAGLELGDLAGGLAVSVSVGVAMHRGGTPLPEAVAEADDALYLAKRSGKDCIRIGSVRSAAGPAG